MVKILLQLVLWSVFMGMLVLWPAGTLAYPGAWGFIALFSLGGGAMMLWMFRHSPGLLRERMSSPVQRAQKPWDRVWTTLFISLFLIWIAFMGWDASRSGFKAVPPWLQSVGGLSMVVYMLGVWWTFRENAFAAPVVKIQQGQKVIDTGPYAIVRHPMYASALLQFIGLPLLLGSWWGFTWFPVFIPGIAWRIVHEERTLRSELAGYEDYCARVRYRLVPFLW